jgi:hypothetical protein
MPPKRVSTSPRAAAASHQRNCSRTPRTSTRLKVLDAMTTTIVTKQEATGAATLTLEPAFWGAITELNQVRALYTRCLAAVSRLPCP